MKKLLLFKNDNFAIIEENKPVSKKANLFSSTFITINKEEPIEIHEATEEKVKQAREKKFKDKPPKDK